MNEASGLVCRVVYLEEDPLIRRLRAHLASDQAVEWSPTKDLKATVENLPGGVVCVAGSTWSQDPDRFLEIVSQPTNWGLVVLCAGAGEESQRGVPVSTVIDAVDVRNPGQAFRSILRLGYFIREQQRRRYLEEALDKQTRNLWMLHEVGKALGAEHELGVLLDLILTHARRMTNADAGSIYILRLRTPNGIFNPPHDSGDPFLHFAHTQSDTLDLPHHGSTVEVDQKSMAGYVALTGEVLNIPDAYRLPPEVPYTHGHSFDQSVGYRTKSMLCLPMRDAEQQIIGVLQLINKKVHPEAALRPIERVEREVIPFSHNDEQIGLALAGQAAVALENGLLYESIEGLFEGLVRASVQAIEARDPPTSGHSARVATLTTSLAETVSAVSSGPFRELTFSPDQLREMRYAALLHDFGKVGVREHILVKAKRLYPGQWENLVMRLAFATRTIQLTNCRRRVEILCDEGVDAYLAQAKQLDDRLERDIREIDAVLATLDEANTPGPTSQEISQALEEIAGRSYEDLDGEARPFLTSEELVNLSVPRGSLNEEERREMESHVAYTFQFLQMIPWTRSLHGVPEIAYAHHERLDGSGYPRAVTGPNIPPQSRMMAVADLYDALTATDRPYKPTVPVEKALKILEEEAENGHLDKDLVQLFIEKKIYETACSVDS